MPNSLILDFFVEENIAKNWRVIYRNSCHNEHIKEYGSVRQYLKDNNFINKKVPEAIKNPTEVRPSVKRDEKGNIKKRKAVIFFKKTSNKNFINPITGKPYLEYIRIVAWVNRHNKVLEIKSIIKTGSMTNKGITKPLKRI